MSDVEMLESLEEDAEVQRLEQKALRLEEKARKLEEDADRMEQQARLRERSPASAVPSRLGRSVSSSTVRVPEESESEISKFRKLLAAKYGNSLESWKKGLDIDPETAAAILVQSGRVTPAEFEKRCSALGFVGDTLKLFKSLQALAAEPVKRPPSGEALGCRAVGRAVGLSSTLGIAPVVGYGTGASDGVGSLRAAFASLPAASSPARVDGALFASLPDATGPGQEVAPRESQTIFSALEEDFGLGRPGLSLCEVPTASRKRALLQDDSQPARRRSLGEQSLSQDGAQQARRKSYPFRAEMKTSVYEMESMRKDRIIRQQSRQIQELKLTVETQEERIGKAVNSRAPLRVGDLLMNPNSSLAPRGIEGGILRADTFTYSGVIRRAFELVGKRSDYGVTEASSGRDHEMAIVVAEIISRCVIQKVRAWQDEVLSGSIRWFILSRQYDLTPKRVHFGAIANLLLRFARYLKKTEDGWEVVSLDEYLAGQKGQRKKLPKWGIIEMMAQRIRMHWESGGVLNDREVFVPPSAVESGTASSVHSAVERSMPPLDLPSFVKMCAHVRFAIYNETPDNSTANLRKQLFTATQLPANALYAPGGCAVHKLQRVIENCTTEDKTVGTVYAISFVCSLNGHRDKMLSALWRVIGRDLRAQSSWEGNASPEERAEWAKQTGIIMDHTVMRSQQVFGRKKGKTEAEDTSNAVKRNLNGNPALRRVQHFCRIGVCACRTEKDRRQLVFATAVPIMPFNMSQLPSINRWGSCRESLADIVGGCMVNGLFDRTVEEAYGTWEDGFVVEDTSESDADVKEQASAKAQRKVWRMKMTMRDESGRRALCLVLFVAEPLDALFLRLQKLDEAKELLLKCCRPATSPFSECLAAYGAMLLGSPTDGPLSAVYYHFGGTADAESKITTEARALALGMAGQVTLR